MLKRNRILFTIICYCFVISGCTKDNTDSPTGTHAVFSACATIDNEMTKTVMDLSTKTTLWKPSDYIWVLSEPDPSKVFSYSLEKYTIDLSSGTASSATFSSQQGARAPLSWETDQDIAKYYYYAFYSQSSSLGYLTYSSSSREEYIVYFVPSIQQYSSGKITNNFYTPMIGKGTSLNNLVFSPGCCLFKVRLTDSANAHETVTSIILDNPANTSKPAGGIVLYFWRGPKAKIDGPYVYAASNSIATLTEINEEVISTEKSFYIVIRPHIRGSFTLTINTIDAGMGTHQYIYNLNPMSTFTEAGKIYKTRVIDIKHLRSNASTANVSTQTIDNNEIENVW